MNINILRNNGIDIDAGLELLGDIETYNDILDTYLEENIDRIQKIDQYKNSGDMKNYEILVHALKGDSKYLGCTSLAEIAYNHQMKSSENDINYVNEHYQELINEVDRITKIFKEYKGEE